MVCVDPAFRSTRSYSMAKLIFFYLFGENFIFRKRLGVATYFCFIFLRENKIRKKTLSVTPYLEKTVCEKPKSGFGVRLLIGKVW